LSFGSEVLGALTPEGTEPRNEDTYLKILNSQFLIPDTHHFSLED